MLVLGRGVILILCFVNAAFPVDIPLRIVSGVNSRSMSKPLALAKGTIVRLDRYDFDSALWKQKRIICDKDDIYIVYKSGNGKERILPRSLF